MPPVFSTQYWSFHKQRLGPELDTHPRRRARSVPLGITSLSPDAQSKVHEDNIQLEYAAWILEQTLACKEKKVDCILVFPEDLGGHQHHGPASIWQLREFQLLECGHGARRGAGFLCQLAHAETKRPLSIRIFLWDGYSSRITTKIFGMLAHFLVIVVALLNTHLWLVKSADHQFHSSMCPTFGPLFWKVSGQPWQKRKSGKFAGHFFSSFQSPSLAAGADSGQNLFNLWTPRSVSSATGTRQGVAGCGISLRPRSRSPRLLKVPGFGEKEGKWQCRVSLVVFFYSGGPGKR